MTVKPMTVGELIKEHEEDLKMAVEQAYSAIGKYSIRELDYSLVREMFISPDSMYVLVEFITNTKPVVYELEYDF